MNAFFPYAIRYKKIKYKAYQHFEISRNELDEVRKLGGFVMGVSELQTTAPISSTKKRTYKKKVVETTTNPVEENSPVKEGD